MPPLSIRGYSACIILESATQIVRFAAIVQKVDEPRFGLSDSRSSLQPRNCPQKVSASDRGTQPVLPAVVADQR